MKVFINEPTSFKVDWKHVIIPNIGDKIRFKKSDGEDLFVIVKEKYFYLNDSDGLIKIELYVFPV